MVVEIIMACAVILLMSAVTKQAAVAIGVFVSATNTDGVLANRATTARSKAAPQVSPTLSYAAVPANDNQFNYVYSTQLQLSGTTPQNIDLDGTPDNAEQFTGLASLKTFMITNVGDANVVLTGDFITTVFPGSTGITLVPGETIARHKPNNWVISGSSDIITFTPAADTQVDVQLIGTGF